MKEKYVLTMRKLGFGFIQVTLSKHSRGFAKRWGTRTEEILPVARMEDGDGEGNRGRGLGAEGTKGTPH